MGGNKRMRKKIIVRRLGSRMRKVTDQKSWASIGR